MQLILVTGTLALLETTNKSLVAICTFAGVSLVSIDFKVSYGWCATVPFLVCVLLLMMAIQLTISFIEKMDSFSAEFKLADALIGLNECEKEEQRTGRKVRAFTFVTANPKSCV